MSPELDLLILYFQLWPMLFLSAVNTIKVYTFCINRDLKEHRNIASDGWNKLTKESYDTLDVKVIFEGWEGKSNTEEKCTVRTRCTRTQRRGENKLGEISWFNNDRLLMSHRRERRKKGLNWEMERRKNKIQKRAHWYIWEHYHLLIL